MANEAPTPPDPDAKLKWHHDHIDGADRLIERFGCWPSFHDAEVLGVLLDRVGEIGPTAELLIHVWHMTDRVNDRGYYVREKHTLVRFVCEGVITNELSGFNHQNVLSGLGIHSEVVDGHAAFRLTLYGSYGLEGSLVCTRVAIVDLAPCNESGQPLDGAGD